MDRWINRQIIKVDSLGGWVDWIIWKLVDRKNKWIDYWIIYVAHDDVALDTIPKQCLHLRVLSTISGSWAIGWMHSASVHAGWTSAGASCFFSIQIVVTPKVPRLCTPRLAAQTWYDRKQKGVLVFHYLTMTLLQDFSRNLFFFVVEHLLFPMDSTILSLITGFLSQFLPILSRSRGFPVDSNLEIFREIPRNS